MASLLGGKATSRTHLAFQKTVVVIFCRELSALNFFVGREPVLMDTALHMTHVLAICRCVCLLSVKSPQPLWNALYLTETCFLLIMLRIVFLIHSVKLTVNVGWRFVMCMQEKKNTCGTFTLVHLSTVMSITIVSNACTSIAFTDICVLHPV